MTNINIMSLITYYCNMIFRIVCKRQNDHVSLIINSSFYFTKYYNLTLFNLDLPKKEEKVERKKDEVEILVQDEDGNEMPYEFYGYIFTFIYIYVNDYQLTLFW